MINNIEQMSATDVKESKKDAKLRKIAQAEDNKKERALKKQKLRLQKKSKANKARFARVQLDASRKIEKLLQKGKMSNVSAIKRQMKGLDTTDEQALLKHQIFEIAKQQHPDADWVDLDNAAMIFPSTDTPDINGMFRLSAILKEDVKPLVLQQALNSVVRRFPTIAGAIKRGFFWYYLEPSTFPIVVEEEKLFPCTRIPMDSRHAGIRVVYYLNRLSVDFFHAVTDGNGGLVFLNTLLGAYLRLQGARIEDRTNYLDDRDKPKKQEMVDSFQQMADFKTPRITKDITTCKIEGVRLNNYALVVVNGSMKVEQVSQVSKEHNATVGQFLTAIIAWAVEEDKRYFGYKSKLPVLVSVPCNLRKFYQTESLRNFISVMTIKSNGTTDFDSILETIKEQFAVQNTKENFLGIINFQVKSQNNIFIKLCPLVLKNIVLKIAFRKHSVMARTTTLSNLGQVKAPKDFEKYVDRYEFILGPQVREMVSFSCCSYKGNLVVSASRTIKESNVVRLFFKKLAEFGVDVIVDTNCDV